MNTGSSPTSSAVAIMARGAGITLLGRIAGRGLFVITIILAARLLGPIGFGAFSLGWTLLRMVQLVTPLGVDNGIFRFASRYWPDQPNRLNVVIGQPLLYVLFVGIIIGVSIYIAADEIAQFFGKPDLSGVLVYLVPAFALAGFLKVLASSTRLSHDMRPGVIAEDLLTPLVNLVGICVFALLHLDAAKAALSTSISFVVGTAVALIWLIYMLPFGTPRSVPWAIDREVMHLLKFSVVTAVAGVFASFVTSIDRIIVGYVASDVEVGVYHAAAQIPIVFMLILGSLSTIFATLVPKVLHRSDLAELNTLFSINTKWSLYLSLPILAVVMVASRDIMVLLFGLPYEQGATYLIILTIAQAINAGTGSVGPLMIMTDNQRAWAILSGIMLVVTIGIGLMSAKVIGAVGVAIGSAVGTIGLSAWALMYLRRRLGIWPFDRRYVKGIVAFATTVGILALGRQLSDTGYALELVAICVSAPIIFFTTLLLLGLDPEDLRIIQAVMRRFELKAIPR